MKTTIDRNTWARGEGPEDSKLLNLRGKMCCLGFEISQHYPSKAISDISTPAEVFDLNCWLTEPSHSPEMEYRSNSPFTELAMSVNDCRLGDSLGALHTDLLPEHLKYIIRDNGAKIHITSEKEREGILVEIFRMGGRELEFIN